MHSAAKAKTSAPLSARMSENVALLYVTIPSSASTTETPKDVLLWCHELHRLAEEHAQSLSVRKLSVSSGSFVFASEPPRSESKLQQATVDRLADVAQRLLAATRKLSRPSGARVGLRMAIHTGAVAAGVIGSTSLQYQLFGPMIDTAAAVSQAAKEGSIVITGPAWAQLTTPAAFKPVPPFKAGKLEVSLYAHQAEDEQTGVRTAADSVANAATGTASTSGSTAVQPAQFWDLTYASSVLEQKFCRLFNSGQIPLDLTFLMIVIVSQASWIHRWTFQGSYLYAAMICLMSFNLLFVLVIVYCRDMYRRWRETFVVASHLLHKVIQLVVTVAPQYGTIHSPTYTALIAVLESSGFAGILMLCFGLRLRFCWQLVVGAATLGMSMAASRPICSSAAFTDVPESVCVVGMGVFQVVACYLAPSLLVYVLENSIRKRLSPGVMQKTM